MPRRERNLRNIQSMYDVSFTKLTERFFKGVPWPPVELLSELVDHDHVFCMLYKVRPHAMAWDSNHPRVRRAHQALAVWIEAF